MSSTKAFLSLVAMLVIARDMVRAQGPTTNEDAALTIAASVERPVKLGLSDVTGMPHKNVHVKDHHNGKDVTYEGMPLIEVLKRAGVPSGDGLRGPNMAICILAEAKDGYKVVFALPELDPGFTDNDVLLVDRADGEPLSATQGPLRIVVPHEKRPARWIRNVQRIHVVRVQ